MKKPIWHRPLGDDAWMLVKSVCSRRDSSRRTPRVHRDAVRTLRTVVDEVADEDPASWIDKRIVSCVGQSPDRPVRRPTSSGRVQRLPAKTPLSTVFRLTCSAYRDRRFFAITLSPRPGRVRANRTVTCRMRMTVRRARPTSTVTSDLDVLHEYSHFGSARTPTAPRAPAPAGPAGTARRAHVEP